MKAEVGRRIKRIRGERGLTQKELASRVGIDFTYIGKMERGEQLPSLKVLMRIAEVLSIPACYFLEDEESAAMLELAGDDLRCLVKDDKRRDILKMIRLLHEDDIPLMAEIAHVLTKHRTHTENGWEDACHQIAAEKVEGYGKRKT